jgi:hypothetical protein
MRRDGPCFLLECPTGTSAAAWMWTGMPRRPSLRTADYGTSTKWPEMVRVLDWAPAPLVPTL